MKLYYTPGACSLADHIALEETGLDYSLVKVDLRSKTTETGGDYRAVNPKGYVPALELNGGEVLTENVVVLAYIAEQGGKLMPAPGMPRWRVLEACVFITSEVHVGFKPFFNPAATEEAKAKTRDVLKMRFATLSDMMAKRDWLVGDSMSIADCYLYVMLRWAGDKSVEVPGNLAAFRDRMDGRPSVRTALAAEGLA